MRGLLLIALAFVTLVGCGDTGSGRDSGVPLVTPFLVDGARALPKVPLEEAQRLVDFTIVQPAELPPDVALQPLVQLYTAPVAVEPNDEATLERVAMVQLFFSGPGVDFYLIESATSLDVGSLDTRPITIGDVVGEAVRTELGTTLGWNRRGLSFLAQVTFTESFTEEAFLAVLESIP